MFSPERKRALPELPQKIGLITSKDGQAINDFQMNLGRFGFQVSWLDSRVEGQQAVRDLLGSIRTMKRKEIDVLVLVRGGGSLESLLSFNNESLVREVVDFPVPVLVGIGHEDDVSLVDLAADCSVSTPSMTAQTLNRSWKEAVSQIELQSFKILSGFKEVVRRKQKTLDDGFRLMQEEFRSIIDSFRDRRQSLGQAVTLLRTQLSELDRELDERPRLFIREMQKLIASTKTHLLTTLGWPLRYMTYSLNNKKQWISNVEEVLRKEDPARRLKMGYSITRFQGKVVRSIDQLQPTELVEVTLQDGSFDSAVSKIKKLR